MTIKIAQIAIVAKENREQASRQARELGIICENKDCPRYAKRMWGNGGKSRGAIDEQGNGETVIWRLRCGGCNTTVTVLPAGLVPHSPFTVETHQEVVVAYATDSEPYVEIAERYGEEGLLTSSTVWNWTDSWLRQSESMLGAMVQTSGEYVQAIDITRYITPSVEEIKAIAQKTQKPAKQQAFVYWNRLCWYAAHIVSRMKQAAESLTVLPRNLLQFILLRNQQHFIFQRS
ncbi:MAG: hypothetical protein VR69_03650 [Peptococcaceae bacterium BRH_c4b]|nr:MAG: hypothetical protein VR69_03650 [Peptococcaceae bacterium BRH_c4b]